MECGEPQFHCYIWGVRSDFRGRCASDDVAGLLGEEIATCGVFGPILEDVVLLMMLPSIGRRVLGVALVESHTKKLDYLNFALFASNLSRKAMSTT